MKALKITNTHGWTPEQLRKHEKTIKNANMRQRVITIRLIMEGYMGKEVATLLNLHRETVSTYIKTFNCSGLETLLTRDYSPGKPCYLTEEQKQELKRMIVESTPKKEGFGIEASWDTRVIEHVLKEHFSVSMGRRGITKMLHKMGLSFTNPTYTLAKADQEEQKRFLDEINLIKKTSRTTWF